MRPNIGHYLMIPLICFDGLLYTSCVKILRHSIPRMVDASNTTELILDCEYVYDANDLMLVVKWFHNSSPEPIYQWIPERNFRFVGQLLKQRIDLNYSVNPNDKYSKYRAVRLKNNITVDLNGNFTCSVSSIATADGREGQMVVYVPPKTFDFNYSELTKGDRELECSAKGVYPKPLLTLSEQTTDGSNFHVFPKVNFTTRQNNDTQYFDATLRHNPKHSHIGTIFECKLEIPSTNYIRRKRIKIIFPLGISEASTPVFSCCVQSLVILLLFLFPHLINTFADNNGIIL